MPGIRCHITILSLVLIIQSFSVSGQERVLHGKVTTLNEISIAGAEIQVKSTKQVVLTDTLGMFSVPCNNQDRLKIRANGFIKQSVSVKEQHKIIFVNLSLKSNPKSHDIAVGYGHVKETDNLMPASDRFAKDLNYAQFSDIYEIIRVKFPGVQINGGEIIVRGISSLTGSNGALLVVDGMVVDESRFSSVNTAEIARIDLLKGSAASVYGVRGANGVVLVETKSGPDQ